MAFESDGASSTSVDAGGESRSDAVESTMEATETGETELYSDESGQELYDPGYDTNEYSQELMDFSYEAKNPETYTKEAETTKNNDKGEPVDDVPLYRDDKYLDYNDPDYVETGVHKVDWPENNGFEGEPQPTVLPENTIIARYGSETGHFATDVGTNPSELSLPYDTDTMEYHEYRLCGEVSCESGKAKGTFDVEGGGRQYAFDKSFAEMVKDGTIEKIK